MEVTKWLKHLVWRVTFGEPRLTLWVNNGSPARASECLLLGVERTSISGDAMSAYSQTQTFECHPIGIDFPDCGR